MTTARPLDEILQTLDAPDELPAVIERLVMEVEFTQRAVEGELVEEATMEIEDTLEDLGALMRAGFLCRSASTPVSHRLQVSMPDPSRVHVDLKSTGAHPNLVPLLVRLIYHLHQTPPDAFHRLVAAFDGDTQAAIDAYAGVDYRKTIAQVRLRDVEGRGGVSPLHLGCSVPASDAPGPEEDHVEWARLVIGGFDSSAELDAELEDAWLSLSMMNAFIPLGRTVEFEPGEEEFFFRSAASGRELVCDALSVEPFWLKEWLVCLVGGSRQAVTRLKYVTDRP